MKSMDEIKKMSNTELETFIHERRTALQEARFNPTARDMKTIRGAKIEIARACTERTTRLTAAAQ